MRSDAPRRLAGGAGIYRFDTGNATDGNDYLDGRAENAGGAVVYHLRSRGADGEVLIGGAGVRQACTR